MIQAWNKPPPFLRAHGDRHVCNRCSEGPICAFGLVDQFGTLSGDRFAYFVYPSDLLLEPMLVHGLPSLLVEVGVNHKIGLASSECPEIQHDQHSVLG